MWKEGLAGAFGSFRLLDGFQNSYFYNRSGSLLLSGFDGGARQNNF